MKYLARVLHFSVSSLEVYSELYFHMTFFQEYSHYSWNLSIAYAGLYLGERGEGGSICPFATTYINYLMPPPLLLPLKKILDDLLYFIHIPKQCYMHIAHIT